MDLKPSKADGEAETKNGNGHANDVDIDVPMSDETNQDTNAETKIVETVEVSGRRSTRRRTQPGRYTAVDFFEKPSSHGNKKSKKRNRNSMKKQSNKKRSKTNSQESTNTSLISSPPGIWTTENNDLISSLCRRPIPQPFRTTAHCPNSIDSIQLGTGTVTAWCPSSDRVPDLYRIEYSSPHSYTEDVTYDELILGIANEKKRIATSLSSNELDIEKEKIKLYFNNLRRRAASELQTEALKLLPELCVVGAWELQREDEWKKKYDDLLVKREREEDLGVEGAEFPRYYGTRHPSSYFRDSNSTTSAEQNSKDFSGVSFTPSTISQRIKLGCNLAYEYCRKKREKELGLSFERSRRSTRAASQKEEELSKPSEYVLGGRVANFILNRFGLADVDNYDIDESDVGQYYLPENSEATVDNFFNPPKLSILEFLGKTTQGSGSFSGIHVQSAIVSLLKEKKVVNVFEKENSNAQMICTTGDTIKEMKEFDSSSFGRCRFSTRAIVVKEIELEIKESIGDENAINIEKPSVQPKQINSDKRKKFEIQRYNSIHSGCTIWPSWKDEACKILSKFKDEEPAYEEPEEQLKRDEVLAASLSTTTSRRSKRAAQSDSANLVFYGAGASITQNQLTDSVHRLIMQAYPGFVTSLELCRLICSGIEPSDWKKVRSALGRLLCREGRIARFFANTIDTDAPCSTFLSKDLQNFLVEHNSPVSTPATDSDKADTTDLANTPIIHEDNLKAKQLMQYLRELHMIELHIRTAIMRSAQLQVNIDLIASSADDDAALDPLEDNQDLEWKTNGHELLKSTIVRPGGQRWLVEKYLPSEESDEIIQSPETLKKTHGKVVKRRARFQIIPINDEEGKYAIMTEAQVRCGLEAFNLDQMMEKNKQHSENHNFECKLGSRITISVQNEDSLSDKNKSRFVYATIVGFGENEEHDTCILLLPDEESDIRSDDKDIKSKSFWATFQNDLKGSSIRYKNTSNQVVESSIVFQDYEKGSAAYAACENVLKHIMNHHKAHPFLEPVDPIKLELKDYTEIIKNPMDLGTIEKKLISGKYSKMLLNEAIKGEIHSPVKALLEGGFLSDLNLTFDNAMTYNPKGSWVYNAASVLKRAVAKKMESVLKQSIKSEEVNSREQSSRQRSVYVDDSDSAVDEAYLESEDDEEFDLHRSKRKSRKKGGKSSKNKQNGDGGTASFSAALQSMNAIEIPHEIPPVEVSKNDLGNYCFTSAMDINSDVESFSLPCEWQCRHGRKETKDITKETDTTAIEEEDKSLNDEILKMMDSRVRRSHRGVRDYSNNESGSKSKTNHLDESDKSFTFFLDNMQIDYSDLTQQSDENDGKSETLTSENGLKENNSSLIASNRKEVEEIREKIHEDYFAKMFYETSLQWKSTQSVDGSCQTGLFADNSFPPYLGRLYQGKWEIRTPYIAPALRWIIRGLIRSGHLSEMEPMTDIPTLSTSVLSTGGAPTAHILAPIGGTVTISNAYYWNRKISPLDVVDIKRPKIKSKNEIMEEEERKKDAERELSEYEQDRARRIARNQEKLRALGLG